jgi:hypothetical protein
VDGDDEALVRSDELLRLLELVRSDNMGELQ